MKRLILVALLALGFVGHAYADESCANVANTATTVLPAAKNMQNVIMCQDLGATAVTCSVGGTPVSVQHGFYLTASGGNMTMSVPPSTTTLPGHGQSRLSGGAVSCITASSTSYVCCESW